jgi:hypothetical protein
MLSTGLLLKLLGVLFLLGLLALAGMGLSRLQQRRIYAWARDHQYAVLDLRFVRHAGGLLFWLPMVQSGTWRITVEDAEGGTRTGWIYFGPWWLEVPWGAPHVQWR